MNDIIESNIPKVFICIGSSSIRGDSLGPLVGTYLKEKIRNNEISNNLIEVYGDINKQVNYKNISEIINNIDQKYKKCIKIIIDSALGNNIENIVIDTGNIYLGKSLDKNKTIYGDINIKGVVGKNYNNIIENMNELKNVTYERINNIAISIIDLIYS